MDRRRVDKPFNLVRLSVLTLAGGFMLAVATPIHASASAPKGCVLGLVCVATPTPTPAAASPTPSPGGVAGVVGAVVGTVRGVTGSTVGTVNNTVNTAVNTVNGLLGSHGGPTLPPTPCVLGCVSLTPTATPAPSGSGGGSNPGSGSNAGPAPGTGSNPGSGTPGGGAAGPRRSSGTAAAGGAKGTTTKTLHGQLAAQSLDLATPPSVLGFGPIPGIDFGNAPFLWPLFLALDAAAFCAVVYVIRRKGFVARD